MAIGVLFGIPTLWGGWGFADDVLQREFILTSTLPEVLAKLYVFLDPLTNAQRMDLGVLPWWTFENAQVAFFRPLSAFSLWLDYQIWPDSSILVRLHNLVWYGLICILATKIFRRLMKDKLAAGLAAILFAVSTAHIGSVVSIAARNLLLTSFFGFLTLYFHDRWRRDKWKLGFLLTSICFVLSLLSAETGVAIFPFLLAYAIFVDEAVFRDRILTLIPYILIGILWWVIYQTLGYGAWGSGFYLNPVLEPLEFMRAILERFPLVLMGQWIIPDPVAYTVFSLGVMIIYWLLASLTLIFIGATLLPLAKKDHTARFWTLGMLLAVIPVCAANPPSGRHLMFISLGAFGLMGQFIIGMSKNHDWLPSRKSWLASAQGLSIVLLALHGFIYPIAGMIVRPNLDPYAHALTDIGELPEAESQQIIIVNVPSPGSLIYIPALRTYRKQPMPKHIRVLASGFTSVTLTRLDEKTLLVQPATGYLPIPGTSEESSISFFPIYSQAYALQYGSKFFRGDSYPMENHQQVELTGMQVEVVKMNTNDYPAEARITFTNALEDEDYIWLYWDWHSYQFQPFTPPAMGETCHVDGPF